MIGPTGVVRDMHSPTPQGVGLLPRVQPLQANLAEPTRHYEHALWVLVPGLQIFKLSYLRQF
jgi:hypothetical protein